MNELNLSLKTKACNKTTFFIKDIEVGKDFFVIAGPCSVESEMQMLSIARSVKNSGAKMLRGGAFKPRTSPYSFQGLGKTGLEYLAKAREETGLPFVTEVMDTRDVDLVAKYADMIQIGARNIQNFSLLKEVGKTKKPILLKRGFSTTLEELLCCAEYILDSGNPNVALCERGIRTSCSYTKNTFDINAIPSLKELTHLPVFADPSHGTGTRSLVSSISLAAVVAGADALFIEVHNNPEQALSDADQQLNGEEFSSLMYDIDLVSKMTHKLKTNSRR